MTASFLTYPLDIVKTYLVVYMEKDGGGKRTVADQFKIIVADRGWRGLYKGLGASLIGIAPYIGVNMSSYDYLMTRFAPKKDDPKLVYYNLSLGALAGTIAVTVTYPTDLIRKLLQLNGQPGHSYTSIFDAIAQRYRSDGIPGFYKGLLATYLKVAPMTAILFLTNDFLKRQLEV